MKNCNWNTNNIPRLWQTSLKWDWQKISYYVEFAKWFIWESICAWNRYARNKNTASEKLIAQAEKKINLKPRLRLWKNMLEIKRTLQFQMKCVSTVFLNMIMRIFLQYTAKFVGWFELIPQLLKKVKRVKMKKDNRYVNKDRHVNKWQDLPIIIKFARPCDRNYVLTSVKNYNKQGSRAHRLKNDKFIPSALFLCLGKQWTDADWGSRITEPVFSTSR